MFNLCSSQLTTNNSQFSFLIDRRHLSFFIVRQKKLLTKDNFSVKHIRFKLEKCIETELIHATAE